MSSKGININSLTIRNNDYYYTALHWAIKSKKSDSIETLLELGARPDLKGNGKPININLLISHVK